MSELTKSRKRNKPQMGQTKLQMEQTKLQTNDITKNHVKKKKKGTGKSARIFRPYASLRNKLL